MSTAARLFVLIEPIRPPRWAIPTYVALVLYSLYGLVVYHLSVRRHAVVASRVIPWLDLLWYLPLIAFTSNTSSIFYYFFFFSIIVASFSWGLNDGLRLTLASAAGIAATTAQSLHLQAGEHIARVVLTPEREVAQLWQSAPDPLTGWRRLRRFTPRIDRLTLKGIDGSAYDETAEHDIAYFLRELQKVWKSPNTTIARAHRLGYMWKDPTSTVSPGTSAW